MAAWDRLPHLGVPDCDLEPVVPAFSDGAARIIVAIAHLLELAADTTVSCHGATSKPLCVTPWVP